MVSHPPDACQSWCTITGRGTPRTRPLKRQHGFRLGRPNGGLKAEELLSRMEASATAGRYELAPDIVSYNCVIGAIVNDSNEQDAADRAQALLDRMEERNIRPDGRTYSPVIELWLKRRDEKGHALAEMMLQQFLEKVEANKKAHHKGYFYEEEVWDVINAYRDTTGEDLPSLDPKSNV